MRRTLFLAILFGLTACSPIAPHIKHLGPISETSQIPAVCKIAGVLPDSPARKAELQVGDTLESVNGAKPGDALAVSDLINRSGPEAAFDVADKTGKTRSIKVTLNKDKPRLGAACDLTGWRKSGISSAGNETLTVFNGPYALTVSGILDKGLAFMRVHVSNHSDRPLSVNTAVFSATDGGQAAIKILSPEEVIYFMHGEDAVSYVKAPAGAATPVATDSLVRQVSPPHKKKADWSRSDETYVQSNSDYVNKESLWPANVEPGKAADGLIYFLEPKVLPVTIEAHLEGTTLSVSFGQPKPSTQHMTADELIQFFDAQKKGTPIRLTLKKGNVFVGKYSSYDSINEIAWFDTPSGPLLTTSSFGLKYIVYAEVLTPENDKKQPVTEPLN